MKAKYLALMIGACFSHNLWAANNITIEQRLAELEQRVVNAEKRAQTPPISDSLHYQRIGRCCADGECPVCRADCSR